MLLFGDSYFVVTIRLQCELSAKLTLDSCTEAHALNDVEKSL